jgi:type II restriction enzyme
MGLSESVTDHVASVLRRSILHKLRNYKPEPNSMPFHTRLLGRDRLAIFSFIQSLNTNFGTAIFEPVAVALAESRFKQARSQAGAGDLISEGAHLAIQKIMDGLTTAAIEPDQESEVARIRAVCRTGNLVKVKLTLVDLRLEDSNGKFFLFDLKTAKPNAGNFKEFKRTLLEWIAATLSNNPTADVSAAIAIPYNPYEPKPYSRWTMRGMLDLHSQLMVAEEFWNFVGGSGAYQDLLGIFERVGIELRDEIDARFTRFKQL